MSMRTTSTPSRTAPALVFALLAAVLLAAAAGSAAASQPKKIVALTPFSANTLVATGVRPAAIGQMAIGRKGISPKLSGVRQLTLSHPNGPNMEQIAQIDPDVVLTSSEWRKGSQTMRDLAITVREMDATRALDVPAREQAIGYAYGSRRLTDRLVRRTRNEINYALKGSASSPHPIRQRPRVLMVLGVGRTPYVFINNSWGGSVARAAGAQLLGGDLRGSGGLAKVSDEYVIQQDPDIILAVPHGNAKDIPSIADFMRNNPAWSTTSAVQNNRVYVTMDDALLQPNVDVGDTIKRLRVAFLKNW
jgi:iron complex transport system substrate-binding protein